MSNTLKLYKRCGFIFLVSIARDGDRIQLGSLVDAEHPQPGDTQVSTHYGDELAGSLCHMCLDGDAQLENESALWPWSWWRLQTLAVKWVWPEGARPHCCTGGCSWFWV